MVTHDNAFSAWRYKHKWQIVNKNLSSEQKRYPRICPTASGSQATNVVKKFVKFLAATSHLWSKSSRSGRTKELGAFDIK